MSGKTKLVRIQLERVTRARYTEIVEVPENIKPSELEALVSKRYSEVDAGEYAESPAATRGWCDAVRVWPEELEGQNVEIRQYAP